MADNNANAVTKGKVKKHKRIRVPNVFSRHTVYPNSGFCRCQMIILRNLQIVVSRHTFAIADLLTNAVQRMPLFEQFGFSRTAAMLKNFWPLFPCRRVIAFQRGKTNLEIAPGH